MVNGIKMKKILYKVSCSVFLIIAFSCGSDDSDSEPPQTDPCDPIENSSLKDTDEDGLTDCEESTGKDNPKTDAVPTKISDSSNKGDPFGLVTTDSDNDGLTDCEELTGTDDPSTTLVPKGKTDPEQSCDPIENTELKDTDEDGLTDCEETTGNDDPRTDAVPDGTSDPNVKNATWSLVWEEEFDNDLSAWNIWEGGAFNDEIQLYREEQLSVANGILTITTQRQNVSGDTSPFDDTQKNFEYVSGRIETKVQYGPSDTSGEQNYRFVARIKLPKGFGMWPAFWSFADPWPTKGEIDVLEARGNEPTKFQSNIFYGDVPGPENLTSSNNEKFYTNLPDLTADFHNYELIWTKQKLTIKLDDDILTEYNDIKGTPTVADLFNNKHQIVLNNAVGGKFFPNTNSANYVNNATMQVDWVRIYKK